MQPVWGCTRKQLLVPIAVVWQFMENTLARSVTIICSSLGNTKLLLGTSGRIKEVPKRIRNVLTRGGGRDKNVILYKIHESMPADYIVKQLGQILSHTQVCQFWDNYGDLGMEFGEGRELQQGCDAINSTLKLLFPLGELAYIV